MLRTFLVQALQLGPTALQASDITIADLLASAGCRCGAVGKWSLGDPGTVERATRRGVETWFGNLNQDHAHSYFAEYLDDDGILDLAGNSRSRGHSSHDLLTEPPLQFLREAQEGPFFLCAACTVPHVSASVRIPALANGPGVQIGSGWTATTGDNCRSRRCGDSSYGRFPLPESAGRFIDVDNDHQTCKIPMGSLLATVVTDPAAVTGNA